MDDIIAYRLHNPRLETGPWAPTRLRQPWMTDLAFCIAWLIFEYPAETLQLAGLAGITGLCVYFAREPQKNRAKARQDAFWLTID